MNFSSGLLGDEFFEWFAWGCGFQGLVCLGTLISEPLLLGDLLGVDLLGSVRQGCVFDRQRNYKLNLKYHNHKTVHKTNLKN